MIRRTFSWISILLLGALTYLNALENPLLFDDAHLLINNQLLSDTAGLTRLLTEQRMTSNPPYFAHYRPLLMLSFYGNARIFGGSIGTYRTTNLLIHLLCALFGGLLARRLLRRLAPDDDAKARLVGLTTTCLFALHPIFSEAVTQVLKRNSSLSSLLVLGALLLFDRSLDRPQKLDRWRLGSLFVGGLAMFVKEDAAVLPALVLLYGLSVRAFAGRRRALVGVTAAYAVVPATYAFLWFPRAVVGQDSTGLAYLLAQPRALLDYLAMLLWPGQIPIASGLEPAALPPTGAQIAGLALVVSVIVAAAAVFRRARLVCFAVLWAAICMAPSSSIFPLRLAADPIRTYLALWGVLVLASLALVSLGQWLAARLEHASTMMRTFVVSTPLLAIGLWCSLGTLAVNNRMGNPIEAWRHAVMLYPKGRITNANYCSALASSNALASAVAQCRKARTLWPHNPWLVQGLVTALMRSGHTEQAQAELARAKASLGNRWQLELMAAHIAWFSGDLQTASRAYRWVLRRHPGLAVARVYLADVQLRLGDRTAAKALLAATTRAELDTTTRRLARSVRRRLASQR